MDRYFRNRLLCAFAPLLFTALISSAICVELTFELADNERQCFHEALELNAEATVDFQVIYGGNYDVDAVLEAPQGRVLMRAVKKQSDTFNWKVEQAGVYTLCFSNEFSTFTHKMIYMDFDNGAAEHIEGISEHPVMTKMETSSVNVHGQLNTVNDYQTHHKLMEAQSRKRAEDLNWRVMYWSIGESLVLITIGIGQVIILKSFFSDRK